MLKRDERDMVDSCWNKAGDDEMVFVLRARDPCAPGTILDWCGRRVRSNLNVDGDPKIAEAVACATMMRDQRDHGLDVPSKSKEARPENNEMTAWGQELAIARRDWREACDQLNRIVYPTREPDLWENTLAARDAAFQHFMMLCQEKP